MCLAAGIFVRAVVQSETIIIDYTPNAVERRELLPNLRPETVVCQ